MAVNIVSCIGKDIMIKDTLFPNVKSEAQVKNMTRLSFKGL